VRKSYEMQRAPLVGDRGQERIAGDGIDDAIRQMTVGIVSGSGPNFLKGLGTGSLVRWAGRHLILTAQHVIENTKPEDLRFFLPANSPPGMADRKTILGITGAPTQSLLGFSELTAHEIYADLDLDLAALVVEEQLDGKHPAAHFHELVAGGVTPAPVHTVMSFGFPHDLTRTTHEDHTVAFSYSEWSEIVSSDQNPFYNFDAATHFLVRFEDNPDAHPRGMSGSARWFRRGKTPEVWHPNVDIAGIVITFDPKTRLTKNVKRESVEAFLTTNSQ
jgi:hypothetical protein